MFQKSYWCERSCPNVFLLFLIAHLPHPMISFGNYVCRLVMRSMDSFLDRTGETKDGLWGHVHTGSVKGEDSCPAQAPGRQLHPVCDVNDHGVLTVLCSRSAGRTAFSTFLCEYLTSSSEATFSKAGSLIPLPPARFSSSVSVHRKWNLKLLGCSSQNIGSSLTPHHKISCQNLLPQSSSSLCLPPPDDGALSLGCFTLLCILPIIFHTTNKVSSTAATSS